MGKADELAAEIEGLGKAKRRRYSEDLRKRIAVHVREQRAAGMQLKRIAEGIGVSPTLLHRWEVARGGAFRRVELSVGAAKPARYVLHAPHGVRVEGLALEELVTVLRSLG